MDATFLGAIGFTLVKLVCWILILLWAISLLRKIIPAVRDNNKPVVDTLWSFKTGIVVWIVVFVAALVVSNIETAYRPKNVVDTRNSKQEERLRAIDNATTPEIVPSKRDTPTPEEASAKNRAENEAARKAFEALPDATPRQP